MKEIEIEQIYNDIVKCADMCNLIRPIDNSFIILIPIVTGFNTPHYYEIKFIKNELIATGVEMYDENHISYKKTSFLYRFTKKIQDSSIIYINIYHILEPIIKLIKREEKLKELGVV